MFLNDNNFWHLVKIPESIFIYHFFVYSVCVLKMDSNELDLDKIDVKNLVLLNTFLIDKCRYRVFYNSGLLIYEKEKSKKGKQMNLTF